MSIIRIGDVNYITAWVTHVSVLGEYSCLTHRGSNVAKLMSHVTRMIGSHTWMNCVTHMDGLCCTYGGACPTLWMSIAPWMGRPTRKEELCHRYAKVTLDVHCQTLESWHTYEWFHIICDMTYLRKS